MPLSTAEHAAVQRRTQSARNGIVTLTSWRGRERVS